MSCLGEKGKISSNYKYATYESEWLDLKQSVILLNKYNFWVVY